MYCIEVIKKMNSERVQRFNKKMNEERVQRFNVSNATLRIASEISKDVKQSIDLKGSVENEN
jgi:hypothetical protein